jgi:uncharacterized protein
MIWRLVAWILLVGFAWWAWRDRSASRRGSVRDAGPAAGAGAALAPPEPMVDCVRCGIHLPASEAMRDGTGRPYCCPEHRIAGPRGPH